MKSSCEKLIYRRLRYLRAPDHIWEACGKPTAPGMRYCTRHLRAEMKTGRALSLACATEPRR